MLNVCWLSVQKRLRKDSALSLEERVGVEDVGDEDSLDGYQPLGGSEPY